jgi:hypothetical protein
MEKLPRLFENLSRDLERAGFEGSEIFQFSYPNPLLGEKGDVCRTPLNDQYLAALERRVRRNPAHERSLVRAKAYRTRFDGRYDSRFEGIMGKIMPFARGRRFDSWNFQVHYEPELQFRPDQAILTDPICQAEDAGCLNKTPVECDTVAEPSDTEVCQALWVHQRLNQAVQTNAARWNVVDRHVDAIKGHGICREGPEARLKLPQVGSDGTWEEGWTPLSYKPYDKHLQRWFRVTNTASSPNMAGQRSSTTGRCTRPSTRTSLMRKPP